MAHLQACCSDIPALTTAAEVGARRSSAKGDEGQGVIAKTSDEASHKDIQTRSWQCNGWEEVAGTFTRI